MSVGRSTWRRPSPRWIPNRSRSSVIRIARVHDDLGFELVRVRTDATAVVLPDLWMPVEKAAVDAYDRPALVGDVDGVARGLRAAGFDVDGPHWDADRFYGWLRLTMPDSRRMLLANDLEPDEWPDPPTAGRSTAGRPTAGRSTADRST